MSGAKVNPRVIFDTALCRPQRVKTTRALAERPGLLDLERSLTLTRTRYTLHSLRRPCARAAAGVHVRRFVLG